MEQRPILAFDVGGSFVKAGLVDVGSGRVLGATVREPTPPGATPEGVIEALAALAARLPSTGPVGMAFPSVAKAGVAYTAANVDPRWIGTDASALLGSRLGRQVVFLNDADAAGIAEMMLGAGRGCSGTVLLLTLGTGIGSALFVDGRLVPNTELGHLEVGGQEAEHRASAQARVARQLDWHEWIAELNVVLAEYHRLLWPDLIIVGGGITENWELFGPQLRSRAPIVRAQFGNDAGIVGAALAVVDRQDA